MQNERWNVLCEETVTMMQLVLKEDTISFFETVSKIWASVWVQQKYTVFLWLLRYLLY